MFTCCPVSSPTSGQISWWYQRENYNSTSSRPAVFKPWTQIMLQNNGLIFHFNAFCTAYYNRFHCCFGYKFSQILQKEFFLGQKFKKQWAVIRFMSVYWNLGQKKLETIALGSISAPNFIAIHLIWLQILSVWTTASRHFVTIWQKRNTT